MFRSRWALSLELFHGGAVEALPATNLSPKCSSFLQEFTSSSFEDENLVLGWTSLRLANSAAPNRPLQQTYESFQTFNRALLEPSRKVPAPESGRSQRSDPSFPRGSGA